MSNESRHLATVLVVDDVPANLKLLEDLLGAAGYRVRVFPDPQMALKAAQADPPDLFLLDILMPGMNGFELCAALKADFRLREIPVLFLSALGEASDKVRAFAEGGVDYVTKPFQEEVVLARVRTHLRIASLQRQLTRYNRELESLVEERTRELARAKRRLEELGRLKDDFLQMISHEMRTPANGVLGVGELLMMHCDEPELAQIYRASAARLLALIEDATLLAGIDHARSNATDLLPLDQLLVQLRARFPQLEFEQGETTAPERVGLRADPLLLERALLALRPLLAIFQAADAPPARVRLVLTAEQLVIRISLSSYPLTEAQSGEFFALDSNVRSRSVAESLGLAPVVAYAIVRAFGGDLQLHALPAGRGVLVLNLLRERGSGR
ncbi:MAG: response regulator [Xanthomonadales bacterium]|jgi:DNA-binding response OmpR family regulator|nr:response regulator [Xanthomonadales bacterium]